MKLSIKEIIKKIKLLELDLEDLKKEESKENFIVYLENKRPTNIEYDYQDYSNKIKNLYNEIFKLRTLIQVTNINTITSYKKHSISELIILLAQKSNQLERLQEMRDCKKISRVTTNDGQNEYTEYLFDPKMVAIELRKLNEEISEIQIAIDSANINTLVEVK
ncbi:hypothetical protein ACP0A7_00690 [Metamycoplasma hominis]|uniref:hypothetical protein n=1 Tax=Metamycoplasma hominis TaxID=2098 RepID=UPI003CF197FB